jgi:hypothetical protein
VPQHWQASAPVARGATGVRTNIGPITPPPSATKIVAIWCSTLGGALLTTAESISGIFELEGPGISVPQQFPLDQENMLTGGDAHLPTHIMKVSIPCRENSPINCFTTLDDTVTGALLQRWGICTE